LCDDSTVAQKDEVRPELDAEGAAQRLALAVLDLDVSHGGKLVQQRGQVGGKAEAMAAPERAELQQDRPGRSVDLFASRFTLFGLSARRHVLLTSAKGAAHDDQFEEGPGRSYAWGGGASGG